jgi:hypothetical protein
LGFRDGTGAALSPTGVAAPALAAVDQVKKKSTGGSRPGFGPPLGSASRARNREKNG